MNDDELIERLRRSAPHRGDSVDPADSPRAAQLMEQIMSIPDDTPATSTSPGRRRWVAFALGGVAAAAIAIGVVAVIGGGDDDAVATSISYSLTPVDPAMTMCLPVTDYVPDPDLVGFRGAVVAVSESAVTLDVSRWYAGGDADQVVLDITDVAIPALDGVEFVDGGEYLVAVLDGQVLTCGLSGPVDPVLEGLYDTWFAG